MTSVHLLRAASLSAAFALVVQGQCWAQCLALAVDETGAPHVVHSENDAEVSEVAASCHGTPPDDGEMPMDGHHESPSNDDDSCERHKGASEFRASLDKGSKWTASIAAVSSMERELPAALAATEGLGFAPPGEAVSSACRSGVVLLI